MGLMKMLETFLERRQAKKEQKIIDNEYKSILTDVETYSTKTKTTIKDARYTRKRKENIR